MFQGKGKGKGKGPVGLATQQNFAPPNQLQLPHLLGSVGQGNQELSNQCDWSEAQNYGMPGMFMGAIT